MESSSSNFEAVERAPAMGLSDLFDLDLNAERLWADHDLAGILRHRLEAPMHFNSEPMQSAQAPANCGQLLRDPHPPEQYLFKLLELFAPHGSEAATTPCTKVVAVLYFATHAAGLARCDARFPGLDDASRLAGFRWTAGQTWVPSELADLCQAAAERLGGSTKHANHVELPALPAPFAQSRDPARYGSEARDRVVTSTGSISEIDGYRLHFRIGEGGMGTVWEAVQTATGRTVALKLLPLARLGSHRARARFEREVALAARLNHPGIVRVYDSGISRGIYYYAMERIEGVPLDRYVEETRLSPHAVLALMSEICNALQHAHQRGIIHRDLKPSNILVTADGNPRVLDFGLARCVEDETLSTVTREGPCAGTLAFMSPEQAAGRSDDVDTRSDVYSLGATLHLLLCGHPPHDPRGATLEVLHRIAREEVCLPRLFGDKTRIDGELAALLHKALALDPSRRYLSAGELGREIDRYLRGDPLSARSPTLAYLLRRRLRKHRLAVAVTAALAVTLVSGATYSYWNIRRARDVAVVLRGTAEQQQRAAESARHIADQRLADAWLAQANALAQAARWPEAADLYERARRELVAQGRSSFGAELGLVNANLAAPPPLNTYPSAGPVTATCFSPDARQAIFGNRQGLLRQVDLRTGRTLRTFTAAQGRLVTAIAWSPNGQTALAAFKGGAVFQWNLKDGAVTHLYDHAKDVFQLVYSPDGRWAASASEDNTVRVWDLAAGRERCRYQGVTQQYPIYSVAFTPDGNTCVCGEGLAHLQMFDARTGVEV